LLVDLSAANDKFSKSYPMYIKSVKRSTKPVSQAWSQTNSNRKRFPVNLCNLYKLKPRQFSFTCKNRNGNRIASNFQRLPPFQLREVDCSEKLTCMG